MTTSFSYPVDMTDREARSRQYLAPALLGVQVLVAAGTSLLAWLQRLSLDACAQVGVQCDTGRMLTAGNVFFVVALALLLGTAALLFALHRRRSEHDEGTLTWVPVLGICLTVISYLISTGVFQSGITRLIPS